jgi:hypothetical protein
MRKTSISTVALLVIGALIGWPMARQATAERIVSATLSQSEYADNGFVNLLGVTMGVPVVRAKIDEADLDGQLAAVIRVPVLNDTSFVPKL